MSQINKSLTSRILTSKLEVERKFVPTPALKKLASESPKATPFYISTISTSSHTALNRLSRKRVTDKYYDRKGQLENHGIWVRWRKEQVTQHDGTNAEDSKGFWEAKVKQGGDFVNSKFLELQGRDAIEKLMNHVGVCDSIFDLKFEVGLMADRVSWAVTDPDGMLANDDGAAMTVVLDTIIASLEGLNGEWPKNFHHEVGELEIEKTITTDPSDDGGNNCDTAIIHTSTRAVEGNKMSEQLAAFMTAHPEIFAGEGAPTGKLTAYIKHQQAKAEMALKVNEGGRIASMSEIKYKREFNGKG